MHTLLIDGSFLARSRYEAGGLAGGFLAVLQRLEATHWPERVVVAWDSSTSRTRRKGLHEGYKAKRAAPPDEYLAQLAEMKAALPHFGVEQVESPEGEADDVWHDLAADARHWPLLAYTADKDWMQEINIGVSVLRAGCGGNPDVLLTAENLSAVTGLTAKGWLDFLTLAGDSVDGVPGVPGIGPGRARALLEACPGLVRMVQMSLVDEARSEVLAADASLATWLERVIRNRDKLLLTRELVRLYKVPLEWTPAALDPDRARLWLLQRDLGYLADQWFGEEAA